MAKVFTHHYVDDLDDSRLDDDKIDVVEFSFRGTDYTLDLSTKNGHQFNKDMAKYIEAALCARERSAAAQAAVNGSLPKKSSNGRRRPSRSNNRKTSRKNTAETALTREQTRPGDIFVCLGAGTISAWANNLPGKLLGQAA